MISKVVIPVAGIGSRLLPTTKELPKEMLPIFVKEKDCPICLKPMLQAIFEQLFAVNFREFGFIVGRGKRQVEDHFTPDDSFVEFLKEREKKPSLNGLLDFYGMIKRSTILFINQPTPKGFGDAVKRAEIFTKDEPFMVHAGDDIVFSKNNHHLSGLVKVFESRDADAVFLVEEVEDPRKYGVIRGKKVENSVYKVEDMVEKPRVPPSSLAVIASYVFRPIIYDAIKKVSPDERGEIQLTDALRLMLKWGCKVYCLKLGTNERRVDIGTPESYLATIRNVFSI